MKTTQKFFLLAFGLMVAFGFYGCQQFSKTARSIRQNQRAMILQLARNAQLSQREKEVSQSIPSTTTTTVINQPVVQENPPEAVELKISTREWIEQQDQEPILKMCQRFNPESEESKAFSSDTNGGFDRSYEQWVKLTVAFAPLSFQMRLPTYREVALALDEEPSLLRDLEFSIQLYEVKKELEDYLPLAKQIQTRAYYGWVLTRLAMQKPDLIGNPNLMDLCLRLQNIDLSSDEQISSQEISEEIYQLMERVQIKPEEFTFNPNFESPLTVQWQKSGFSYSIESPELQYQYQK